MIRREFLRTASATAAMLSTVHLCRPRQKALAEQSVSDRLRIGCIGVGGQGRGDSMLASEFAEIVAICDADLRMAEGAKELFGAEKADIYQDYRRVLDRKDIDAVIVATPDHWHTKINVDACRAGKDVYGEKPLTLTIDEGKLLCKVVKDTGRVFQTGTQQRSDRAFQTAIELVRNGRIGKLKTVWVAVPYFSTKGGPFPNEEVPQELDWDLFQGQAPIKPYNKNRTQGVWRWWYEYAGGIITDWGNHHVDIAHWGMDCESTGPISVEARGLFPNEDKPDCYNTPDRFVSKMVYPNGIEMFYCSAMKDLALYGAVEGHVETSQSQLDWMFGKDTPEELKTFDRNGIMFIGDRGRLFVNRGGVYGKAIDELKDKPLPSDAWKVRPSDHHVKNFFDCVRSRDVPVSPVDIEHRSITACHLTNISVRLNGRQLTWDPVKETIVGDDEAKAMQSRPQREPYTVS
ncbi:MAG: Gfo/Idh/MocA family protein [Thermoguttaceae bacterium]